jgi:hypothetical protein
MNDWNKKETIKSKCKKNAEQLHGWDFEKCKKKKVCIALHQCAVHMHISGS